MKKTININLGGLVFQIDEDAYSVLESYLATLKRKFGKIDEQDEIIGDIEFRFAELFTAKLDKNLEVVTIEHVNEAIATMGTPEEIDDLGAQETESATTSSNTPKSEKSKDKKLFRDTDDVVFGGVLSGLGYYLGIDAVWLRLAMVVLTIASVGVPTIPIYFIMWLVVPKATSTSEKLQMKGEPVNLSSIEASVKKNFQTDELKKITTRINSEFGDIIKTGIKIIAAFTAFFIGVVLIILTLSFAFGTIIPAVTVPNDLLLLFPNPLFYIAAMVSLFLLIAIPLFWVLYLCLKLFSKTPIRWGTSLVSGSILWVLALLVLASTVGITANQFKEESSSGHYIAVPSQEIAKLTIDIPGNTDDFEFRLAFDKGRLETNGYEYNKEDNSLLVDAVTLKIVASADSTFKVGVKNISRGKTKKDAEERLNHFENDGLFVNDSMLQIPTALLLNDEDEWRAQRTKYVLHVPIGKEIDFTTETEKMYVDIEFSGEHAKSSLLKNSWRMTNNGLECISCN